jgi:hypothetical protein
MNYEELLESRHGAAMSKQHIPFGWMHKKLLDGKYVNVVDLRDDLRDSLVFTEALVAEANQNKKQSDKRQIRFSTLSDSAGLYGVAVEGTYRTYAQLLADQPAIVAQKNFVDNTIKGLLETTTALHEKGIFQVCYSPDNVFSRKGDDEVMLLFHGSAYKALNDQQELYGESAAYIAPEVLEEGVFDERADIYSIGKFMETLYQQSEVPFELKGVIKKATETDPLKRYGSADEMLKAINNRQSTRSSLIMGVAALLVVAICFGVYFSVVPERENIEFVKPAPKDPAEDLLDDGFDPVTELGIVDTTNASRVDKKKMKEYEAKAEQIFRKNYTREAERILSKIYSNEQMRDVEKNFMAGSHSTMQELVQAQTRLGAEAGIADTRSQLLASQIIEQVTNRLKKQMEEKEKNKE